MKKVVMVFALLIMSITLFAQNPWNGKVVLQGFWWDYWNTNTQNSWADYLAELSPTMRDVGIDMVWIPPAIKNQGTNSNGYSPFDPYDLGDKFQKGSTTTRFGTKDQYLRAVAVMHANGLGVIQDVVLNHRSNAGAANGAGGQDPEPYYSMKSENGYKTFRHVSYATPVPAASVPGNTNAENQSEYWNRSGRFSMNYTNFHPNMWTNTTVGDWAQGGWGPDISYEDGRSYGPASNVIGYNPNQYLDYNRVEARNWMVWLKKQTGVDGFRWDAVKHFPFWIVQDLSWNVKYNASWANGGANMFNVGEWPGSANEMDNYINQVKTSNGGNDDLIGTFDFSLRGALYGVISSNGSYDLGSIPGQQQSNRYRTVPFVNNHDTFRPKNFTATGNYYEWNDGTIYDANHNPSGYDPDADNEKLGKHINPEDGRIQVAYAIAFSVDGSPQVFFEDLFVINNNSRLTHKPHKIFNQLQIRDYLKNIIWCHNNLNFKGGAYKVRWQAQDALVIERSNKAIIGVNDNWTTGQMVTVQTDFGPNKQLHDYSGANSGDIWTNNNGQVTFWIPPCDGSNLRRGYCIWGPAGIAGGYVPSLSSGTATTQEWEMSDDLGDSHASSLKQGGALPATGLFSKYARTAGRVFAANNTNIHLELYRPENSGRTSYSTTVALYNDNGTSVLKYVSGISSPLILDYTTSNNGYYTIKAYNTYGSSPKANVFIKATYSAPPSALVSTFPKVNGSGSDLIENSNENNILYEFSLLSNYPNPFNPTTSISFTLPEKGFVTAKVYNMLGQEIAVLQKGEMPKGMNNLTWDASKFSSGTYLYSIQFNDVLKTGKMILAK